MNSNKNILYETMNYNISVIHRLQGYTEIPIPSHRTIQKCLVDIGDKPSSFINSKQWIGSTEVGFVLESLLGISVKILCASTGAEVPTLARNLLHHFQTQGTPVMIGLYFLRRFKWKQFHRVY